jgi:uncharacterized protein (DUF169 family)
METNYKESFIRLWKKYFNNAGLPIVFYYTDEVNHAEPVKPGSGHQCIMGSLARVLQGASLSFSAESVGCFGGKKYLGFSNRIMPDFEYFLSCGIPGQMEGERYKKTPELVTEILQRWPRFEAPARFIIFKRWDKLDDTDNPDVVIFFASPDIMAGLFTLANYDEVDPNGVIVPFGSGCSSIVQNPYLEKASGNPRAVMGMFDTSARPFVAPEVLTFAVPMNKFMSMVSNMEESFLITDTWKAIQKRIK